MPHSTYRIISALRMRQFELLCVLAETSNMRRAAERLHVSTAAVSKGLAEIENQLGTSLFNRLPQGLTLTAAGNTLVHRARSLLSEVALLADDLRDEREGRHEVLRIGAPPFVSWTLLPDILRHVREDGSQVSLQIVEGRLDDMQQKLSNHEIDLLLTMNTPSELGRLDQAHLQIRPICHERWLVVCHPQHPAAALALSDLGQRWAILRQFDWILPPRPTQARLMFEQCLLDHGLAPIAPAIESTNAITNLKLAMAGHGMTLLARRTVQPSLDAGELVEIVAPSLPSIPIVMAHRDDTLRRDAIDRFYTAALAQLADGARRGRASSTSSSKSLAPRKSRP